MQMKLISFNDIPHKSLHCKLVPVQRVYEYGLLEWAAYLKRFFKMRCQKRDIVYVEYQLMIPLQSLTFPHDYIFHFFVSSFWFTSSYIFAWFSLSDATTNLSQESTWTSVVCVAGTRLHASQSEEKLNGHRLSLNGLLVIMKCVNVLTVFFL